MKYGRAPLSCSTSVSVLHILDFVASPVLVSFPDPEAARKQYKESLLHHNQRCTAHTKCTKIFSVKLTNQAVIRCYQ